MSSDTTEHRKRWQVWALLPKRDTTNTEAWVPVTMKYEDKRTANRIADQLWLIVDVLEVEEEDSDG